MGVMDVVQIATSVEDAQIVPHPRGPPGVGLMSQGDPMHRSLKAPRHTLRRPLRQHAIALATALAWAAGAAGPAQAQFYSVSGSVSSSPVNLFPISTGQAVLDLGSNRLFVGGNAVGSFSALAGAQMSVGQLVAGYGGSGSISVSGAGALVQVGGSGRLDIGSWGTGSLTVSGGGIVDATVIPTDCSTPGVFCGINIGNGAGSTANLLVTGSGSELRTLGFFGVGFAQVNTVAHGGFNFGTPGGTTTADIKVLAGGTLRTANTTVGQGAGGPAATGTESAFATVLIDGPGSQWVVARNTVSNSAAIMTIGGSASGNGAVTVTNGGLLRIDGTGSPGPFDGLTVGGSGTGSLVVSGIGSRVETISSQNPFINVGTNNSAANGSFQILAGATAKSLYANVGRNGGFGAMVVDGSGSLLELTGVGVVIANTGANGSPGFMNIGRNSGNGQVTVSNGGRIVISDGGLNGRVGGGSPGLIVGRDANSLGLLTISGPGSTVEIVSTALAGLAPGEGDNFNPFVAIGYDTPASARGTLMIQGGGKLLMTGNAVSTPTNGRATGLNIGGRSGTAGTGSATVTGAGSEIRLSGYDAYIGVGRTLGSTGTLQVLDQAQVSSTSLAIGVDATGTVTVDNALIALSGHRTDSSAVGAGSTVGRGANGVGQLNLSHGALFTITPDVLAGGMSIGGDQFLAGGSGSVALSGGSAIRILGNLSGNVISIGYNGNGSASLTGASSIDVGDASNAHVGRFAGGVGTLTMDGASTLRAGLVTIGGNSDTVAGGNGSATLTGAGTELRSAGASGFMSVGRGGIGTLSVSNQAKVAAIVLNVGRATGGVGTLTVNNGTLELAGQQTGASPVGAAFSVGNRGGIGTATIVNNSRVTITNLDPLGADLNVGGTPINPLGNGVLTVAGGSQVRLVAAPGLARARIGHDGTGTATFSGASLLDVGDGKVIIAGLPGSVGSLTLSAGSVLNASYVGVGSLPGGIDGGSGRLLVNASTVNATTLEIGRHGLLGGHLGVVNAAVINRGTIAPGNSPGKIIINGSLDNDHGAIVLDVEGDAGSGFTVDQLVLTDTSTFNFKTTAVTFNFLGNTNPTQFAASGGLDLDNFIQVQDSQGNLAGLSAKLASQGSSWEQAFTGGSFAATSAAFNINLQLNLDTTGTFQISAVPVPEPQAWALWLVGLAGLAGLARLGAVRRSAPAHSPTSPRRIA